MKLVWQECGTSNEMSVLSSSLVKEIVIFRIYELVEELGV